MSIIDRNKIARHVIEAWKFAGNDLNFEIITPYEFSFNGRIHQSVAYLPHFGSSNGMLMGIVWPPGTDLDKNILRYANEQKMFCSFVSIGCQFYDIAAFKEALQDWGYFGPPEKKPAWLEV